MDPSRRRCLRSRLPVSSILPSRCARLRAPAFQSSFRIHRRWTCPSPPAHHGGRVAERARDRLIADLASSFDIQRQLTSDAAGAIVIGDGHPRRVPGVSDVSPSRRFVGSVSTVTVAGPVSSNVRVIRVDAPREVPVGTAIRLVVDVGSAGLSGMTTTVIARVSGVEVARAAHQWTSDAEDWRATLDAVPVGEPPYIVRVEALALDAERTAIDNAVDVAVDARRSPFLVEVYEPRPSWATTFVRRALEGRLPVPRCRHDCHRPADRDAYRRRRGVDERGARRVRCRDRGRRRTAHRGGRSGARSIHPRSWRIRRARSRWAHRRDTPASAVGFAALSRTAVGTAIDAFGPCTAAAADRVRTAAPAYRRAQRLRTSRLDARDGSGNGCRGDSARQRPVGDLRCARRLAVPRDREPRLRALLAVHCCRTRTGCATANRHHRSAVGSWSLASRAKSSCACAGKACPGPTPIHREFARLSMGIRSGCGRRPKRACTGEGSRHARPPDD